MIGDCFFLQTTGGGPQSSGGQRSPRRKSTFSTALIGNDGFSGPIGLFGEGRLSA